MDLEHIVSKCKFNSKLLITTSLLDNGINLNDDLLTNIIITTTSETQFIQMLGRKRRNYNSGEKINLFLKQQKPEKFSRQLNGYIRNVEGALKHFDESKSELLHDYYQSQNPNMEYIRNYFYFDGEVLKKNVPGIYKLKSIKHFCEYILDKFIQFGENAFLMEQLSWLGLERQIDPNRFITAQKEEIVLTEAEEYFDNLIGKPLSGQAIDEFKLKFAGIYFGITKSHYDTHVERRGKAGLEKTIKLLQELNLPYSITLQGDSWEIQKLN